MTGRVIPVDPNSLSPALSNALPGDILLLQPGIYANALDIHRVRGERGRPITLRGQHGAIVDGGRRFEDFRLAANREARRVQEEGKFPGLYEIADRAQWRFTGCEWLTVEDLEVRGCWPTCIYLNDCRSMSFTNLTMQEGTFAFYAVGTSTRGIQVERCRWVQDISTSHDLWSTIGWNKVHGDAPVRDDDARAYDGDFFRAYAIQGAVTIRNNTISDAFNGVHIFNDEDHPTTNLNRDVWIYRNSFVRIRDNPIEPEVAAFNWWSFQNTFYNCHAWFSLELALAAHFYIFANTGWFDDMPGPIADDTYGGGVIKLEKKKRLTAKPGPHYVFNNSWYLRSTYIKNGAITNFHHVNNAAQYCRTEDHGSHEGEFICSPTRRMLWESGETPGDTSFTRDWPAFNIEFANDMIAHRDFPDTLVRVGYPIRGGMGRLPGFIGPARGVFELEQDAPARGRGVGLTVQRPAPLPVWRIPAGLDLGAYQGQTRLDPPADFSATSEPDHAMDRLIAEVRAAGPLTRRTRVVPT
jgi:hypothetical protein